MLEDFESEQPQPGAVARSLRAPVASSQALWPGAEEFAAEPPTAPMRAIAASRTSPTSNTSRATLISTFAYAAFLMSLTVSFVWMLVPAEEPLRLARAEVDTSTAATVQPTELAAATTPVAAPRQLVDTARPEPALAEGRAARDTRRDVTPAAASPVAPRAPTRQTPSASTSRAAEASGANRSPVRTAAPQSTRLERPVPSSSQSSPRVAGLLSPTAPRPGAPDANRAAPAANSATPPRSTRVEPVTPAPEPSVPRAAEPTAARSANVDAPIGPLPRVAIEEPVLVPPVTPTPAPEPAAPAVARSAAAAPAAPPVSVASPIESERSAIRDVLGRYRSAYSALDATAARQVWPTVNERSLSKAFDQIERQSVAFDNCRIDVKGVQAEAFCTGSTRFVPTVGSRSEQVVSQRWNFQLRKASERGWLIQGVEATR